MPKPKKLGFFERLKNRKSAKVKKDLEELEKISEPEKRKQQLKKSLFSETFKKKKSPRKRYKLDALLQKAGLSIDTVQVKKYAFRTSLLLTLALSIITITFAALNQATTQDLLIFQAALWTAGFLGITILVIISGATYLDIKIHTRREEVEKVLPDYLMLVAANIGAGMTIDRALWLAVRPRFGVLAAEIEQVAKRVLTGEDLDDALREFSEHYDSDVLHRSINLLLEGIAAGGKIADLLHKISLDIQEQRILRQEMAANVMTYVIFITFASIVAAPALFGLSTQLLVVIQGIAANLGSESSGGLFAVNADVVDVGTFRIFSMVLLSGTAMMSGFIISSIRSGDLYEGLKYLPMFILISLTLYLISAWGFSVVFGGLI